jgi:hypothetical protein
VDGFDFDFNFRFRFQISDFEIFAGWVGVAGISREYVQTTGRRGKGRVDGFDFDFDFRFRKFLLVIQSLGGVYV